MKLNSIGYLIKSGFKGIFSHGLMSFATVAIITACLIIMGAFSLLVVNINDMIAGLEDESNVVVAFIDENLSREEAVALEPAILAVPNVDSAQFVTREEAAEDFQSDYDEELFDVITDDTFRDRYVVQLQDISLMEQTRTDLYAVDGVAKVNAHLEYAEGFITARNIVSVISLILIVILIVVSFFIMTNTIKLATFTRREEIAIMKMVGASNGFIRCPFIVEGLVLGLLGGALAFLAEWGLYGLVSSSLLGGLTGTFFSVVPFSAVMWPLLAAFLGVGVLVGVFGGSSAIRNYLKV
ncbi:MAG TPA: ABC transporter permease [Candidatus Scatomorpha stercorigallinarum]|nr:ABC transporter permease [Candidatus Scatomorpha stercorigallinarum]